MFKFVFSPKFGVSLGQTTGERSGQQWTIDADYMPKVLHFPGQRKMETNIEGYNSKSEYISSVHFVAKRYIQKQKCLKGQIGTCLLGTRCYKF